MFSDAEREILRKAALEAAARELGPRVAETPLPASEPALERFAGVFVTWRREGRPRGRSGTLTPDEPLITLVEKHAVEALLHDPRFAPATARELPRYVPEISVLFSFEEIPGVEGLLPGTHGVFVEKGKRRGVVLPQDAALFGWDGARLLSQACLRAGLPEESWQASSPPRLLRFTAEVF